jgi:predicted nicotinamide N-methyase
MDTLVQISPFLGHARTKSDNVVRVYDFVGSFQVIDQDIQDTKEINGSVHIERVSKTQKQFTFPNTNKSLLIEETQECEGGIGAGCWLSGICLSTWLVNNPNIFQGKRVLELGSGVGLCGIITSCLDNVIEVNMTDMFKALTDTMKYNVHHNQHLIKTIPTIQRYNWKVNREATPYDVIIASDCVYHNTRKDFKQALLTNIKPNGKIILVNPPDHSRPGIDEFLYEMSEVGDVQVKHLTIKMNDEFHKALMLVIVDMHE